MRTRSWWVAPLVIFQLVVACSSGSQSQSTTTSSATASTTAEPAATSTTTATTTTTTTTSTTSTSTTTPTTTTSVVPSLVTETRLIGKSVQGRDITAYRMGDPTGRPVLLIGVIH